MLRHSFCTFMASFDFSTALSALLQNNKTSDEMQKWMQKVARKDHPGMRSGSKFPMSKFRWKILTLSKFSTPTYLTPSEKLFLNILGRNLFSPQIHNKNSARKISTPHCSYFNLVSLKFHKRLFNHHACSAFSPQA